MSLKQSPRVSVCASGRAMAYFSRSPVSCLCPAHAHRCPECLSGSGFLLLVPPRALRLQLPSWVQKAVFCGWSRPELEGSRAPVSPLLRTCWPHTSHVSDSACLGWDTGLTGWTGFLPV